MATSRHGLDSNGGRWIIVDSQDRSRESGKPTPKTLPAATDATNLTGKVRSELTPSESDRTSFCIGILPRVTRHQQLLRITPLPGNLTSTLVAL